MRACVAASVLSVNATSAPSLSLFLSLIYVISFPSQSKPYFTFHSYLSAASSHYYFPCLCFSAPPSLSASLLLISFPLISFLLLIRHSLLHSTMLSFPPCLASPVFSATLLADFPHCFKFVVSTFVSPKTTPQMVESSFFGLYQRSETLW